MVAALRALGVTIDQGDEGSATWHVTPGPGLRPATAIDCGLAGTVLRFVPPLAALAAGETRFTGDAAASARPVAGLLDGLRQLGAGVTGRALPFSVTGPAAGGGATIDASPSSQLVSGLLLAGARFPDGLDLRHDGGPIPSRPHIVMTLAALAARGVTVETPAPTRQPASPPAPPGGTGEATNDAEAVDRWVIAPGPIRALDEVIEPDLTNAAVFLAAALVAGGSVTVAAWPARTTQPGGEVPDLLARFGGRWSVDAAGLTMTGDGHLRGGDFDLRQTSELTPVVAALAALAETPTTIRGVAHIRGHETDRLSALAHNVTALGGRVAETADGLVIHPGRLHGAAWRTLGDHRLAHAAALIGLRLPGVILDDVTVVAKTMPDFADRWERLLEGDRA